MEDSIGPYKIVLIFSLSRSQEYPVSFHEGTIGDNKKTDNFLAVYDSEYTHPALLSTFRMEFIFQLTGVRNVSLASLRDTADLEEKDYFLTSFFSKSSSCHLRKAGGHTWHL